MLLEPESFHRKEQNRTEQSLHKSKLENMLYVKAS